MTVSVAWPADLQPPDTRDTPGLLVLLANGPAGYRSLCRLTSLLQSHADREARLARGLSWDDLRAHRAGLLCLSGGRRGWIERCVRAGDLQTARRLAGRLAGIYEEQTFLSLELHTADDIPVAQEITAIGQFLGIPPAAVQPVYCLAPEDAPRLRLLAAIDHNCPLDAVPAALPDNGDSRIDLHWLSPAEMTVRFAAFPDTLAWTGEIAQRCAPALPGGAPLWPTLDLPDSQTPAEAIVTQANAGLATRYGPTPDPAIQTRLARELDAINRYGYAPLFIAPFSDPLQRKVLRAAYEIVGQPHHLGVHSGGVVITPGPLTDILPVQWSPKRFVITQFDHQDVEALGLPKLDLLGIRALTVLADATDLIRRDHDPAFQLTAIPPEDAATGALLARGDTVGVFQCESEGARRTLRQLNARTVQDLAIANAFFKPGPATGGLADAFVQRYRGAAPVRFLHPALEPILAPTMGVLLFQEQILRVAVEVAGLNWEQAGYLRRGMSKMDAAEMAPLQQAFEQGCQRQPPDGPGFTPQQAHQL